MFVNRACDIAFGYRPTMPLGQQIKAARKAAGLTQIELVAAVRRRGGDLSQPQLSAIEKDEVERPRCLPELAAVLALPLPALLGIKTTPVPQVPLFTDPAPRQPAIRPGSTGDIPVWASVAAGNGDGEMILTDTPIDYIKRSDHIANAVNPFAFYIVGDSMEERFYQGDQVVVNRSLPLRPGDDCVFIAHGDDGQLRGLVKRLLRSTAEAWKVRQLNPRKDFDLPKRPWAKAYRIVEIRPRG